MPRYSVDFNDVETFDTKPEGEYEGTVEAVKFREPRSEGKHPQIALTLVITDGEFDDQRAWVNISLSPKALFRAKKLFDIFEVDLSDALDFDTDDPDQIDDDGNILDGPLADLVGEPVIFTIAHETYRKEVQERALITEWLGQTTEAEPEPEPEDEPEAEDEDEEEAPAPRPRKRAPARAKTSKPKRRALR